MPVRAVDARDDLSAYLWLGVRRGTLFGIPRERWAEVVGAPGATYLVLATPHPLSPIELLPALRSRAGRQAGIAPLARVRRAGGTAYVFSNDPSRAGAMADVPLHASPQALLLWFDRTRPRQGAGARLLEVQPVIPRQADGARALARALGDEACFRPLREGGRDVIAIEARDGEEPQDDCLDPAELP
jgi:hypothetical protein